ncbi:DUF427 domain-containing protein [Afifella sp. IM 167]|uniref:DUF427 domain-containing protein n=1 Tax=Afifella sp. IM 167 TaxID=2033586 RepID=UPI001CC93547|nr:DUF427 domain-containing protein [Afifella sp. IM 167]MBZ8133488.1 hypothetical protein [Afifella sp. IM 167]
MAQPERRRRIRLSAFAGTVRASQGGTPIASSTRAVLLEEEGYPAVYYLPRQDLKLSLLYRSATITTCPYKGVASYYSLKTADGLVPDVCWSYENPYPSVFRIATRIAFDPRRVELEVTRAGEGPRTSPAMA